jgi:hypothetical protein
VLLPSTATRLGQDLLIADKARKLAGSSVIAYWNDTAAVYIAWGSVVGKGWAFGELDALHRLGAEAKRPGAFGRLVDWLTTRATHKWRAQAKHREAAVAHVMKVVPGADSDAVARRIEDWRTGGITAVSGMFEALALPQAAQVARLADEGRADLWLNQLPVPANPRRWYWFLLTPLLVAAVVVGVLVDLTPVQTGLVGGAIALPIAWLVVNRVRKPMKGQPINTALPVIPVTQGSAPTE